MNENENLNNAQGTENEQQGTPEIVVEEPGKVRKILKWVLGGVALVATAVGGFLLGKGSGDKEDEADSADAEGPKED